MPWLLLGITFSVALVAGLAAALATGSWWLLPAALAVHFAGTLFVAAFTGRMLEQTTKPDAVTEARIDEEGVRSERHVADERKPVI